MSEFSYRVKMLDCLLGHSSKYSLKLDGESEATGTLQTTVWLQRLKSSYTVECVLQDSQEQVDDAQLFFEILGNGALLSGVRKNSELFNSWPELSDSALDFFLTQAFLSVSH